MKIGHHALKVVAVILGFFIWFYVLNSEPIVVQKNFEVEIILDESLAFVQMPKKQVTVSLKGARAFVETFLDEGHKIFLDFSKKRPSLSQEFVYFLREKDIPLPFNVEVLDIKPRLLRARIEKRLKKEVPIKVTFLGGLSEGVVFEKFQISPDFIEVSGPESLIKKLHIIESSPVDLEKLDKTGHLALTFPPLDPKERISIHGVPKVAVDYSFKSKRSNLKLKNIPIFFLTKDRNFRPQRKFVDVEVFVEEGLSQRPSAKDIKVVAPIPDGRGSHQVELRAQLPQGVHLKSIGPPTIFVERR